MSNSVCGDIGNGEEWNKKGNVCVKEKRFHEAIKFYTIAIEESPDNSVYHSNRCLCHQKVENYGLAIEDATDAIRLDPNAYKAYFRRAMAYMSIGRIKNALDDLNLLYKALPNENSVCEKLKHCTKMYNEEMFAKAIQCKKTSAFDLLNLESLKITDDSIEIPITDKMDINDAEKIMTYMKSGHILPTREMLKLLVMARNILKAEKSLVRYVITENSLLTVCGDVHGQFYDLCHIFERNGLPSENNAYLFNGDFVDRGAFSVEVITLLLVFKVVFPNHFLLNRGNHESLCMNKMYGFEAEVKKKYTQTVFDVFSELFQYLPIAHLINEQVLILHGGLPAIDNVSLADIENINRFKEPPDGSVMFDLLWADPSSTPGRSPSPRGMSKVFGADITSTFVKQNNLKFIIRSHECQMEGYSETHDGLCYTIFSAPNYCDEMGNKGAYIHLKSDLVPVIHTFEASPHPQVEKGSLIS